MPESLRAHFLIAVKGLRDRNFFKTVVLMIEDGEKGSMGLVMNQPSDLTVQQVLEDHFELPDENDLMYIGGPVEPSALFILHNAGELDPQEPALVPGLFVGSTEQAFQNVMQRIVEGDSSLVFRIFRGCAGWAPQQLSNELSRGDWLTVPADAEDILNCDPYDLWDKLNSKVGNQSGISPVSEGNPEWN